MSQESRIAKKGPFVVEVQANKTYYWCACGHSKNQPFCDGSHVRSGLEPVPFTATSTETVYFCGCKRTANKPFCDGTHSSL